MLAHYFRSLKMRQSVVIVMRCMFVRVALSYASSYHNNGIFLYKQANQVAWPIKICISILSRMRYLCFYILTYEDYIINEFALDTNMHRTLKQIILSYKKIYETFSLTHWRIHQKALLSKSRITKDVGGVRIWWLLSVNNMIKSISYRNGRLHFRFCLLLLLPLFLIKT